MSFHNVSYRMRKHGYTFSLVIVDLEVAKLHMGVWASKIGMNGTVLMPMWILREDDDGGVIAVPGSEPDPESQPITIPKYAVKGMFKWPPEKENTDV